MYKRGFLASFASLGRQNARKWPVFQGFRNDARKSALRHPCVMVRHGGRRCVISKINSCHDTYAEPQWSDATSHRR